MRGARVSDFPASATKDCPLTSLTSSLPPGTAILLLVVLSIRVLWPLPQPGTTLIPGLLLWDTQPCLGLVNVTSAPLVPPAPSLIPPTYQRGSCLPPWTVTPQKQGHAVSSLGWSWAVDNC